MTQGNSRRCYYWLKYLIMESAFIVIGVINCICAFIVGGINASKGHSYVLGFLEGLLLGVVGILHVVLRPSILRECPYCTGKNYKAAAACKHCGKDLLGEFQASEKTKISSDEFAQLTYRQKYAITEYGFLLSSEDAEVVGEMLRDYRDEEIPAFCQKQGKKVEYGKS